MLKKILIIILSAISIFGNSIIFAETLQYSVNMGDGRIKTITTVNGIVQDNITYKPAPTSAPSLLTPADSSIVNTTTPTTTTPSLGDSSIQSDLPNFNTDMKVSEPKTPTYSIAQPGEPGYKEQTSTDNGLLENKNALLDAALKDNETASQESPAIDSASDMRSPGFMFNVGNLSPTTKKYSAGGDNVRNILTSITTLLLVILPTLCVLFMVFGGLMIIVSGGASEKVTKGKNIIVYNIVAIVIALFSYSIIRIVIWLLGSTAFS